MPSGENRVVESEIRALRSAGHEVMLVDARTDDLQRSPLYDLSTAYTVATGYGRSPAGPLRRWRPDVVHVQNLFPNLGWRWFRSVDLPIVVTLHNFRPLCANGSLVRDGGVCTLCPDHQTSRSAFRFACYRDSRVATLPVALGYRGGLGMRDLLMCAEKVIVLSEVARRMYLRSGVPEQQMEVWPNFLDAGSAPSMARSTSGEAWLYVGRLGPEKGILPLVRAWPRRWRLVIVGDGPQRDEVRAEASGKPIDIVGLREREEVIDLMGDAVGLVFPSVCYENFPLVYAEAMAVGLPVLAWEPNVVAAMVRGEGTGHATTWADDLNSALDRAAEAFPELRARCRRVFEDRMSQDSYLRRAERMYREAVDRHAASSGSRR